MNRAVSFDLWGTLIVGNPEYQKQQAELVMDFHDGYTVETWIQARKGLKQFNDNVIAATGSHMCRRQLYKLLLPNLSPYQLKKFIDKSDEIFIDNPPSIKENFDIVGYLTDKGFTCYLSSNTMFTYGNVLYETIVAKLGFKRFNCKFSDETNASKPAEAMFTFPIKPTYHFGDNKDTDGACEKFGIKHVEISSTKLFSHFTETEQL